MKAFLTSSPDITDVQMQSLCELLGREQIKKMLVVTAGAVPYGLNPRPVWLDRSIAPLRGITDSLTEIDLEDESLIPKNLDEYDLVFITGGNVFYLAYRIKETDFGESLKKYIENGGVYAGSSAGSVILMDDLHHFASADDPTKAPRVCRGLGVLDEALICHADHIKYGSIMIDIASAYEKDGLEITRLNDGQVLIIDGAQQDII